MKSLRKIVSTVALTGTLMFGLGIKPAEAAKQYQEPTKIEMVQNRTDGLGNKLYENWKNPKNSQIDKILKETVYDPNSEKAKKRLETAEKETFLEEKLEKPFIITRKDAINKNLIEVLGFDKTFFDNKEMEFESVTFSKDKKKYNAVFEISDEKKTKKIPANTDLNYIHKAIISYEDNGSTLGGGTQYNTNGNAGLNAFINYRFNDSLEASINTNVGTKHKNLSLNTTQGSDNIVFKEGVYVENSNGETYGGITGQVSKFIGTKRGKGIIVGGGLEKRIGTEGQNASIAFRITRNEIGKRKSLRDNVDGYTRSDDDTPFSAELKQDPLTQRTYGQAAFTPFFNIPVLNMIGIKAHAYYDRDEGMQTTMSIGIYIKKIPWAGKYIPIDLYIGVSPRKGGFGIDIGL